MVAAIASGDKRPELKWTIDQLVESTMNETKRIFQTRSRWAAARLLQLAKDERNPQVAFKATTKCLELAGAGVTVDGGKEEVRHTFVIKHRLSCSVQREREGLWHST